MAVSIGRLGVLVFRELPESRPAILEMLSELIVEDADFNDGLERKVSPFEVASWLKYNALQPALAAGEEGIETLRACAAILEEVLNLEAEDQHVLDKEAVVLRIFSRLSLADDIPLIRKVRPSLARVLVDDFGSVLTR